MNTVISWLKDLIRSKQICWVLAFSLFLLVAWFVLFLVVPVPLFRDPYATVLYSADHRLLGARISADGQWRFPEADSVPRKFEQCITTFEDKRFFYHPGVDPLAIGRALVQNIRAGSVVSGASSLTMQIARMARDRERTLDEKLIEIGWALYLETRYSKRELLALYAAHAPFGGNVVGLESAAWRYFGRSAHQLSWAESAMLAVLPNAPALIHLGRNREQLEAKRNRLLHRLYENGVLSAQDFELACLEPLPDAPMPLPNKAPHLLARLSSELKTDRIQSTLDFYLQQQVERVVKEYAGEYRSNFIYNAAAVVLEVESGKTVAYVGNVPELTDQNQAPHVDIVTASRSTGSILKPFLYAVMLHGGEILPATLIPDTPLNIDGFSPQNYNKTFYGSVPAHVAIERSLNVPLVRMLRQYNTGKFLSLLRKSGMTTLPYTDEHYGASLILGGAEGSLWEITGMYASLARVMSHYRTYNGRYDLGDIHPPTAIPPMPKEPIISITDKRLTTYPLYSAAAIWHTFEAMSAVNRPEEEADWQQFESMKKIAWKTGTSYGNRDAWAIGITPHYIVGVWVGNASGEGRTGLTGVGSAAPILFDIFSFLPASGWFDMPYDELDSLAVCRRSGHKASPYCTPVDTLLMPQSGVQTALCPYHRQIHLSPDSLYRVNSSCERVDRMLTRSWFVLPPAQEYYYRRFHIDYEPLPPIKPGCADERNHPIEIIYPENRAILFLPKGFDGKAGRFVFSAAHQQGGETLFWHIDQMYMGETRDSHQMAFSLQAGRHQLTLVDSQGNERKISFEVK